MFENLRNQVQHTLLSSKKRFWIANEHAYQCGSCPSDKIKPIKQLMADLPVSTTATGHKVFEICGLDYLRFVIYVESRCTRKAYGLIFTCVASCAIHVEIATSLTSKVFLFAFIDIRGKVEIIYFDNGSTFQADAKILTKLFIPRSL